MFKIVSIDANTLLRKSEVLDYCLNEGPMCKVVNGSAPTQATEICTRESLVGLPNLYDFNSTLIQINSTVPTLIPGSMNIVVRDYIIGDDVTKPTTNATAYVVFPHPVALWGVSGGLIVQGMTDKPQDITFPTTTPYQVYKISGTGGPLEMYPWIYEFM